jgi:phosphoenolpyruvate phosphomutase
LPYDQRFQNIKKNKYINYVVEQSKLDYFDNLIKFKPDYLVHGDDWSYGIQKNIRKRAIKILKGWGGRLVEFPYDYKYPNSKIRSLSLELGTSPINRQLKLSRLIKAKKIVKILEAHNPISAMIVEQSNHISNDTFYEFDAIWSSSLTDSVSRGKPDNQSVDYSTRILGLNEILEVTTKPIIFDADNGGKIEHLPFIIKSLERIGISAVVLEDKVGLKQNSLLKNQNKSSQDSINNFCKKIKVCLKTRISKEFLIIARIESLVLDKKVDDALKRAVAYSKAGADLIFLSCKDSSPKKLFLFSKLFSKSLYFKPIVAVPSTYSQVKEADLVKNNIKIVIYANHLLRASYPAMFNVAKNILINRRALESERDIAPIKEIINLIK